MAKQILESQLAKIIKTLLIEKQLKITVSESAYDTLLENALGNLDNGGRGIGNIVENLFINPLSRWLFDNEVFENASVTLNAINAEALPVTVNCTRTNE